MRPPHWHAAIRDRLMDSVLEMVELSYRRRQKVSGGGVPIPRTDESGTRLDVASACDPVLVVQSFGSGKTGVPVECGLRGITRQWKPEPLHHRLQRRSLEAQPNRGSPGASDHPPRLCEN